MRRSMKKKGEVGRTRRGMNEKWGEQEEGGRGKEKKSEGEEKGSENEGMGEVWSHIGRETYGRIN